MTRRWALFFVECISPKYHWTGKVCLVHEIIIFSFRIVFFKKVCTSFSDDSSAGLSVFGAWHEMREWIPDAHEKSKQETAFWDVFIGRIGRNPNSRMILHGSIGAPPLPTLYSLGPVFVTQSRQHSNNIRKVVHFSSGSPSMGYIPLFVGQRCALHIRAWNASEMLGWSGCHCIWGYHKPWWTPTIPCCHFLGCGNSYCGIFGPGCRHPSDAGFQEGEAEGHTTGLDPPLNWENRAPKNGRVNQVLWWCRISPIFSGCFKGLWQTWCQASFLACFARIDSGWLPTENCFYSEPRVGKMRHVNPFKKINIIL